MRDYTKRAPEIPAIQLVGKFASINAPIQITALALLFLSGCSGVSWRAPSPSTATSSEASTSIPISQESSKPLVPTLTARNDAGSSPSSLPPNDGTRNGTFSPPVTTPIPQDFPMNLPATEASIESSPVQPTLFPISHSSQALSSHDQDVRWFENGGSRSPDRWKKVVGSKLHHQDSNSIQRRSSCTPLVAVQPCRSAPPSPTANKEKIAASDGENCLRYKVLARFAEYEVRRYASTSWLSTVLVTPARLLATLEGYQKLSSFMASALNSTGMPRPMVLQIKHSEHPGVSEELDDFTMSFPLLTDLKARPASDEVLIDKVQEHIVYSRSWECYPWELTDKLLAESARNMTDALRRHGQTFFDRYVYLASYGSPTDLSAPAIHELWIYASQYNPAGLLRNPNAFSNSYANPYANLNASPVTVDTRRRLCRGLECPTFDVLRVYPDGIQKRRYYDSVFATASSPDCTFTSLSVWKGLMPLHLYRHGINSQLDVIEATRPVGLVKVQETGSLTCKENITVALYLPARLHFSPPQRGSSAPAVKISRVEDLLVYVWPVGGYLLEPSTVRAEMQTFKKKLTEFGLCFEETKVYIAFYDFIVRFHGRQNELWLVARTCPEDELSEDGSGQEATRPTMSQEIDPEMSQGGGREPDFDYYYGFNADSFTAYPMP